ncbi:hypothetical protein F4678DRAFT_133241 [Xylaria arbuscula]|nr:hypothetical protein F4678DRAFT_133241 [Xylaria arbuscula]
MSLVPPHYHFQEVKTGDLIIASIALGFTIGFGQLTTWKVMRQTWQAYRRTGLRVLRNVYIWMIWGEVLVCLAFSIICFLYIRRIILPSFVFYFLILTLWALQVHFLLQIIINRCRLVAHDKKFMGQLKVGVAILITAVNISVYNIWIPARLEISQRYIHINNWWDHVEKVIYLLTDGFLNIYFIRTVQHDLVQNGLTKYRSLVHFNMFIIGFSLSMDVLIIAMMSLPNTFVYMQFHPLAYIVKLNIELSMADLIAKIARMKNPDPFDRVNLGRSSSNKFGSLRSRATSNSGTTLGATTNKRPNIGVGWWDQELPDMNGVELSNVSRPSAVYTVNATANNSVDFDFENNKSIYTTREFRVDFEDAALQSQMHGSATDSNNASTSKREDEDTSFLQKNQEDMIIPHDPPQ